MALYEAVFAMMESLVPEFDVFGFVRERTGNIMPGITPSSIHSSSDGKHIQIGANGDAIFKRFIAAIGRDDLVNDASLADNAGRDARRNEIYALIDQWVAAHTEADVLATLERARCRHRASTLPKTCSATRSSSRAACWKWPNCRTATIPHPRHRAQAERNPGSTEWLGPALGEHNAAILQRLGYSDAAIAGIARCRNNLITHE